jgi:hypothetical protein
MNDMDPQKPLFYAPISFPELEAVLKSVLTRPIEGQGASCCGGARRPSAVGQAGSRDGRSRQAGREGRRLTAKGVWPAIFAHSAYALLPAARFHPPTDDTLIWDGPRGATCSAGLLTRCSKTARGRRRAESKRCCKKKLRPHQEANKRIDIGLPIDIAPDVMTRARGQLRHPEGALQKRDRGRDDGHATGENRALSRFGRSCDRSIASSRLRESARSA